MEQIIQILMLFVVLNGILKLSLWRMWQAALFGVLCAAFIIWVYPYAITQSKTQLADMLQNSDIMQNMAVLVSVDSAVCTGFCFATLGERGRWALVLHRYVTLLTFPVLFYLLTQSIFSMSGTDFSVIAWGGAVVVAVAVPLLSYALRWLLPEGELRLEMHFLVSVFVAAIGLICTVNGNVTYAATEQPVNWQAISLSMGLFALMFLIGFVWNRVFLFRKKIN